MRAVLLRVAAVALAVAAIVLALAIPEACVGSSTGNARADALLSCLSRNSRIGLRVSVVLFGLAVALVVFAASFDRSRPTR